ncbi:MAG: family 43 glycosylhydrolase [Clostridia bacterium]|nr:family 43 glycosylhydrolase [Clostridia bacterium]
MKPDCKNAGMNPFLPFETYIPDGEPKVFNRRVYLYGSYDLFGEGYCSKEYHVFSAPVTDLTVWTDHGVSFRTDDVPWSDALLYAPDVLFLNGKYYLFFCLSDGTEGVAQSDKPEGPFNNARQITLNGKPVTGIDPSVLEDNGHIYYTWGQFNLRMGELCDDLCTLKPETVKEGVLTNDDGAQGFHEGSSLRKIGDKYCIIYASEYSDGFPNKGARPTKLDYTVSSSPYGPYERRGTVIDNTGCDPSSWNNHGSVIKIGGEWFVFYHSSTNNTEFSRRARAEKITVDETNAVIKQTYPSSNGFLTVLKPENIVSPVNAFRFFGGAYLTEKNGGFPAVIKGGISGFEFSPVSFEDGEYTLSLDCTVKENAELRFFSGEKLVAKTRLVPCEGNRKFALVFKAERTALPLRFEFCSEADNPCEVYGIEIAVHR